MNTPAHYGNVNVGSLFWADDIIFLSETEDWLQKSLDGLNTFCTMNKLKVNIDKTKCMIFNKGGRLLKTDKFFFDNKEIEIVRHFSYLGFLVSPSFSIKELLNDIYKRGLKAYYKLKNILGSVFRKDIQLTIKLFDALVRPILLYGVDVWGCFKASSNNTNPIEKLNIRLCKNLLGVKRNTSNVGCRCELGRHNLIAIGFKSTIKNWLRIASGNRSKIISRFYDKSLENSSSWATKMKNILFKHGMGDVWEQHHNTENDIVNSSLVNTIHQRIMHCKQQNTFAELHKQPKMRTYCQFKGDFIMEPYLSEINLLPSRVMISKFRLSDHRLEIESGRYHRPKKRLEDRKCQTCDVLEDEKHCLLSCRINEKARVTAFNTISKYKPSFSYMNTSSKFLYLMTTRDPNVAVVVYEYINTCLMSSYEQNHSASNP